MKRTGKIILFSVLICLVCLALLFFALCGTSPLGGAAFFGQISIGTDGQPGSASPEAFMSNIPEYCDMPFVTVNDGMPSFTEEMKTAESWESYSSLDRLGRCGTAFADIGPDLMPSEERQSIGMIKPSGWHTVRYDDLIDDKYLYNRCHLIGFQLTGENANERNLITGTRYMNICGMLPFENKTAEYIRSTGNHVLYRVTPVFCGSELVARGVQMEAFSVEDDGEGICFNVFVYNVQPGITIDYSTGDSRISES